MNKISFKLACVPPKSTHQAGLRIMKKKNGQQFVGKFATSKSKHTQSELTMLIKEFAPPQPLIGPLKLKVRWVYPYRKAEPKKNRDMPIYCNTRPDCDNLVKGIKDIMTRLGFYLDDGQIAHLDFMKLWSDDYGIFITVEELT